MTGRDSCQGVFRTSGRQSKLIAGCFSSNGRYCDGFIRILPELACLKKYPVYAVFLIEVVDNRPDLYYVAAEFFPAVAQEIVRNVAE